MGQSPTEGLVEELSRLGRLHLQVRRLIEAADLGAHAARGRLGGGDFIEHRAFQVGDEANRIDWRASAKGEGLLIREQRAERRLDLVVSIDSSASMSSGEPVSKWRYGCWLGLGAAYAARRAGDAAELRVGGGEPKARLRLRSVGELAMVADELEKLEPAGPTDLGADLEVLNSSHQRGLLLVVSDLLSADASFWQGLAHYRGLGWHVVVLRVLAHDELRFDHRGPVRFTGLEGEEPIIVDAGAMRAAYLEELQRFDESCREAAATAGLRLIFCDTGRSPIEPLRHLLETALP